MAKNIIKTTKVKNKETVDYSELVDFIGNEFEKRDAVISGIKGDITGIKGEIKEIKEEAAKTKNEIMTAIDGLAGKIDEYQTEQAMVKHELKRHEGWCEQLAQKTGVELED